MQKIIIGLMLASVLAMTLTKNATATIKINNSSITSLDNLSLDYSEYTDNNSSDLGSEHSSDYGNNQSSKNTTQINVTNLTLSEPAKTQQYIQNIQLSIDGKTLNVKWENNQAVAKLKELVRTKPLILNGQIFGAMEQTAPLPETLSTKDNRQMRAQPGDIMLYTGRYLVFFFGHNSWDYTKMGQIEELEQDELDQLLNKDSVVIKLFL